MNNNETIPVAGIPLLANDPRLSISINGSSIETVYLLNSSYHDGITFIKHTFVTFITFFVISITCTILLYNFIDLPINEINNANDLSAEIGFFMSMVSIMLLFVFALKATNFPISKKKICFFSILYVLYSSYWLVINIKFWRNYEFIKIISIYLGIIILLLLFVSQTRLVFNSEGLCYTIFNILFITYQLYSIIYYALSSSLSLILIYIYISYSTILSIIWIIYDVQKVILRNYDIIECDKYFISALNLFLDTIFFFVSLYNALSLLKY